MLSPTKTFIDEYIQRGRKKPKKFRHFLKIPTFIYDELIENGILVPENYYISESAFFEFTDYFVTISFESYCYINDLHIRILDYLASKSNNGKSPVERGGTAF
jgi:hypothetical protein